MCELATLITVLSSSHTFIHQTPTSYFIAMAHNKWTKQAKVTDITMAVFDFNYNILDNPQKYFKMLFLNTHEQKTHMYKCCTPFQYINVLDHVPAPSPILNEKEL